MKTKYILLSALSAIVFCACDGYLDAEYNGGSQSQKQIARTVEAVPVRINSSVSGMYAKLGEPYGYFGSSQGRADDGGYPAICLSLDLNSGDMTNPVSGYDWFSPASEYSDRTCFSARFSIHAAFPAFPVSRKSHPKEPIPAVQSAARLLFRDALL